MKLAILSDFHLGYERFFDDAYKQASEALQSAASMADALVIPGDIFDNRTPKPEVIAQAVNIFRGLKSANWKAKLVSFDTKNPKRKTYTDLPIIAIPGTHERRSVEEEDAVELLNLAGLLVNVSESTAVIEKSGERVAISGIGGIAEDKLLEELRRLDPKPVPGVFNVFMFHQSIYELMQFNKDFLKLDELPEGFDLYVDGHIHSRVETKAHGKPLLIPGSTVLTQLRKEETEKGFFIFDTSNSTYNFVKINARPFFNVDIDVTGKSPEEINSAIEDGIKKSAKQGTNPVIRITLSGTIKEGFTQSDMHFNEIIKNHSQEAYIEINRTGVEDTELIRNIEGLRTGSMDNIPVKDLGLGILVESIKNSGYDLRISPAALFEILSSGEKNETVKKAISELLGIQQG
ncbi:MAG: DNA repair exonuclease [Candidatus Micrarchaeia archaeon]